MDERERPGLRTRLCLPLTPPTILMLWDYWTAGLHLRRHGRFARQEWPFYRRELVHVVYVRPRKACSIPTRLARFTLQK
jgi:hypothetical protein